MYQKIVAKSASFTFLLVKTKKKLCPSLRVKKNSFIPRKKKLHSYPQQKRLPPLFLLLDATKAGRAKKDDLEKFMQNLQLV